MVQEFRLAGKKLVVDSWARATGTVLKSTKMAKKIEFRNCFETVIWSKPSKNLDFVKVSGSRGGNTVRFHVES